MNATQAPTCSQNEKQQTDKHILLVDDDPAFRAFASMLLTRNGYRVSQACDGGEALQSVQKMQDSSDSFDLLFTDLKMESMSGLELINQVRALGLDVQVLVVTGFLDEVSFEELQHIKKYQLLIKPFKPQELLQMVERLTSG